MQSGRVAQAVVVSSSPFFAQVVNASGNLVTIMLRDSRSGGLEATAATDFSLMHMAVTYEGV